MDVILSNIRFDDDQSAIQHWQTIRNQREHPDTKPTGLGWLCTISFDNHQKILMLVVPSIWNWNRNSKINSEDHILNFSGKDYAFHELTSSGIGCMPSLMRDSIFAHRFSILNTLNYIQVKLSVIWITYQRTLKYNNFI